MARRMKSPNPRRKANNSVFAAGYTAGIERPSPITMLAI